MKKGMTKHKTKTSRTARCRIVPSPKRTVVVDPVYLKIAHTATGLELHYNGHPILFPDGSPLSHPRLSMIEHIREEFLCFGTVTLDAYGHVVKPNMISAYIFLSAQHAIETEENHPFWTCFRMRILLDPCLSPCAGPECIDQMARWRPLNQFCHAQGITLPVFPQTQMLKLESDDDVETILRKRLELPEGRIKKTAVDAFESGMTFAGTVETFLRGLGPEEWAVMNCLMGFHNVLLFPLLLVSGLCTAHEYANGVMAAELMLSTVVGELSQKAHAECSRAYTDDAQIALRFLDHARCPWSKEIKKGEDETQEFKATLRYDLDTHQNNTELEHSLLKNVVAFLNSRGGTIFAGICNDGSTFGIESDGFDNDDKWALHLVNRIGQHIGKRFLPLCSIAFDKLHGKSVSRIEVSPSNEPAFLDERALKAKGIKEAFFIRGGPSALKLDSVETQVYILTRFTSAGTSRQRNAQHANDSGVRCKKAVVKEHDQSC